MSSRRQHVVGTRLSDLPLDLILERAGGKAAAILSCMARRYKRLIDEDEELWHGLYISELSLGHLKHPLDHAWNERPTFKEAYGSWWRGFQMYEDWGLVARVHRCWHGLREWLLVHFPEAIPTLREGASEDMLDSVEEARHLRMSKATRILYRLVNGQVIPANGNGRLQGLIGGCKFYETRQNVYLIPLEEMANLLEKFIHERGDRIGPVFLVASSWKSGRYFLDSVDGCLYVSQLYGSRLPAVPTHWVNQGDGMLIWLEEHLRRLTGGIIRVRTDEDGRSICQFPEAGPLHTTVVSHGVQVRASVMFLPDHSLHQSVNGHFHRGFVYSSRMSLLAGGCDVDGQLFPSCTLRDRDWTIHTHAPYGLIWELLSPRLVGIPFPKLIEGGEEYIHQGEFHIPSETGSIEGWYEFVSEEDLEQTPFRVMIPMIPLEVPSYIF